MWLRLTVCSTLSSSPPTLYRYRLLPTGYRLPFTAYRLPPTLYHQPSTVYRLPSTIRKGGIVA